MKREYFNTGWVVQDVTGVFNFKPSEGEAVTLPHDAMIGRERSADAPSSTKKGYFPYGACEYVKVFDVPADYQGKRVTFEFEGCYNNTMVYLNGELAGQCPYGYSNFYVKADPYLRYGAENELKVIARVNDDSRWYSGMGLYRNVRVMVADPIHVALDGVKVDTAVVDGETARVDVCIQLENEGMTAETVRVEVLVLDPGGAEVARDSAPVGVFSGEGATLRLPLYVKKPQLWNVETPNLYRCQIKVLGGDKLLDEEDVEFGIRILQLDPIHGLRINGESVKLRGACIHHDNGVIGAATVERAEERRVQILKESGFNAIRSSHHPASKALLTACDRLGMLVMDECFDMWTELKSFYDYSLHFPEWWERDVAAMVDKDYNHPSVILYSIGNEIPDIRNRGGNRWGRRIAEKIHALDPGRFTINSMNGMLVQMDAMLDMMKAAASQGAGDKEAEGAGGELNEMMAGAGNNPMAAFAVSPFLSPALEEPSAAVDVAGYNYMTERYELDHEEHPNRIICGSETFSVDLARNWALVKKHPYLLGDFCWTGWDYLGEAGIGKVAYEEGLEGGLYSAYPWYVAWCGDIDILGNRRPSSYYKEIVFGLREEPYLAVLRPEHYGEKPSLTPWSWSDSIGSWSFSGYEGKPVQVEVYADADEVELFLNGESAGRSRVGGRLAFCADFELPYRPGELKAVAYREGKAISETALRSACGDVCLRVEADRNELRADTTDLAFLPITLTDPEGNLYSDKDCMVTVEVEGAGSLMGLGSAQPCCAESTKGNAHTTFDGRALAVIRPDAVREEELPGVAQEVQAKGNVPEGRERTITVTVRAEGIKEQKVVLTVR